MKITFDSKASLFFTAKIGNIESFKYYINKDEKYNIRRFKGADVHITETHLKLINLKYGSKIW